MIINHSHCITVTTPFIYETPRKSGSHTTVGLELLLYPPKPNTRMWPTVAEVTVSTYVVCLCVKVGVGAGAARCVDPHTQHCGFIRLASVSLHFDPVAINTSLLCSPSSSLHKRSCPYSAVGELTSLSMECSCYTHTHTHPPLGFTQMCWWPSTTSAKYLYIKGDWKPRATEPNQDWDELNWMNSLLD